MLSFGDSPDHGAIFSSPSVQRQFRFSFAVFKGCRKRRGSVIRQRVLAIHDSHIVVRYSIAFSTTMMFYVLQILFIDFLGVMKL